MFCKKRASDIDLPVQLYNFMDSSEKKKRVLHIILVSDE